MPPAEVFVVGMVAAGAAAAAVVVIRRRPTQVARNGRALGALMGIVVGTALWWLTVAFVLWIVFLAMGGLIGLGIERRLGQRSADHRWRAGLLVGRSSTS